MLDAETQQWIEDALKFVGDHGDVVLKVHEGKITNVSAQAARHVVQVKRGNLTKPKDLR